MPQGVPNMSSTVHASFQQMAELIKTYMADHKVKFLMKHVPTKVYIYTLLRHL